jgi:hypothetical protein
MVDPTYSQENAASTTTTDSGPSQQETNMTIKLVVFLIFCYAGWTIYKTPTYVKEDTTRRQHYKCPICKRGTGYIQYSLLNTKVSAYTCSIQHLQLVVVLILPWRF